MMRGLILVDVDGPLNPWAARPGRRPDGYAAHGLRPVGWERAHEPLRVWLRPDHGRMLLNLASVTGWELVWATTWQDNANELIGPLIGLPRLPVIRFGRHPGADAEWKYPAVLDYVTTRPIIWMDDDFEEGRYGAARAKFETERAGVPTLLHHVSPRVGLTENDLTIIQEWASALGEGTI